MRRCSTEAEARRMEESACQRAGKSIEKGNSMRALGVGREGHTEFIVATD